MRLKNLLTNLLLLTILFSGCKAISNWGSDSDKNSYDTNSLHIQTTKIKEHIATIDSIAQKVGVGVCDAMELVDTIHIKYANICAILESYDFASNPLLSVDDCIVKDEKVKLPTKPKFIWFKSQMEPVDSMLRDLEKESRRLKKKLKVECLRKFEQCNDVINNPKNKSLIRTIKKFIALKNMPEEQFFKDSIDIEHKVKDARALINDGKQFSPFYQKMTRALVEDVYYRLAHKVNDERCNNAHIRWSNLDKYYVNEEYLCEAKYIRKKSAENWEITIDSQWVAIQTVASKDCAIQPRGCKCTSAINYDSTALRESGTCIGCMDPSALNYCRIANRQTDNAPCKYAACTKMCYEEVLTGDKIRQLYPSFKAGRDELVQVDSLCINNLCGCMNPCADNYDSTATIPDGTCTNSICGCLDSTAVNYAWRNGKNGITKHDSTLCNWTGCTDPCSKNYNKYAKISDGSCMCDSVSVATLDKWIKKAELETVSPIDASVLQQNFESMLNRRIKKYSEIDFNRVGMDLAIDVGMKEMKIQTRAQADGYVPGVYNFVVVRDLIDALVGFLIVEGKGLLNQMIRVKLVGEADGKPIRGSGIEFEHNDLDILKEINYTQYSNGTGTSVADIRNNLDFTPNSKITEITRKGEYFKQNETLAFLRALMVRRQILTLIPDIENRILIGAKANSAEGRKYRKVSIVITLVGFYSDEGVGGLISEDNQDLRELREAKIFFENNGYASSTTTYNACPCIIKKYKKKYGNN